MSAPGKLPEKLLLEVVTPEGLLLREEVDHVQAPGELGYFGVLPGHTPFLSTLGIGVIRYDQGPDRHYLTCFWGFCEVLPDRVNILAEVGERAENIDPARAEAAKKTAEENMKRIKDEAGFKEAHVAYIRAVTRLGIARRDRSA
jgi:F-type H+-transporting ATPase subunit epsilon